MTSISDTHVHKIAVEALVEEFTFGTLVPLVDDLTRDVPTSIITVTELVLTRTFQITVITEEIT